MIGDSEAADGRTLLLGYIINFSIVKAIEIDLVDKLFGRHRKRVEKKKKKKKDRLSFSILACSFILTTIRAGALQYICHGTFSI